MARIGGFTERRQLRRAADQALLTAFHQPPSRPDALYSDLLAVHADPVPPQSAVSVVNPEPDDYWQDPDETPPLGMPLPVVTREDISAPRRDWHRNTRVLSTVIALAVIAIAVSAVLLFSRDTDAGPGQPKVDSTTTPSAPPPTSAAPAPSATAPPPAPPPEAPPPPPQAPPSAVATGVPQYPQYPRQRQTSEPPEQQMPQIDVTRTPFSATPPPPQKPQYNQGDGQRAPRNGFGF